MTVRAKICGINDAQALDAAVAHGASYVGFVFYPRSPRYLAPSAAGALARRAPAGVVRVGLFVDVDDQGIEAILKEAPLDMLQFHGAEPPERIRATKARLGLPVMKAIKIGSAPDLEWADRFGDSADWLLFDAKVPATMTGALPGGNALSFDWQLLSGARIALPWMLSGGLTSANVAEAVRTSGAQVVDVSSGVEDRPGHKDPGRIAEFLRVVRSL
ncbi:MAG: phosphoribosylanthranilate isomerase [Alphaproteobacteria bacterium]